MPLDLFERTAELPPPPPDVEQERRAIKSPISTGDKVFRGVLRGAGASVLVITALIAVFLIIKASGALGQAGWSFLTTETWIPDNNRFGIASLLPNGIFIALIALVVAVPIAVGTAIYVSEFARGKAQRALIALIDLMAAIPSIVYGLWGVFFLQPRSLGTFRWMSEHLSFLPFFTVRGLHQPSSFTSSTFLAGLVVAMMVIPLVASICREVFSQAPAGEREGAYALGATRWGMVRTVVLPYGRGGMIGAIMLGFGRAMGETIAIALIISPTYEVSWRVLENHGLSIAALIALRYQEATQGMLSSLLAAGLVLFIITLLVNAGASLIVTRSRSGAQTGG